MPFQKNAFQTTTNTPTNPAFQIFTFEDVLTFAADADLARANTLGAAGVLTFTVASEFDPGQFIPAVLEAKLKIYSEATLVLGVNSGETLTLTLAK